MIRVLLFLAGLSPIMAPIMAHATPFVDADQLRDADVVLLGEVHDNPAHHAFQAEMLRQLTPAAVVFEMLAPDQADLITPALLSDLEALPHLIGWEDSGWPDFALYRPIFEAIGTARVYGAAVPRDAVRAAVTEGAAAQFRGDPGRFGLDQALANQQQALRQDMQRQAHCNALPEDLLPGMVEAQRLRDAAFAATVLQALEDTGGPVVMITGNGHVRTDWAVPHAISLADPTVTTVSVGQYESDPGDAPPVTFWRVTAPVEREDPCAVFNRS